MRKESKFIHFCEATQDSRPRNMFKEPRVISDRRGIIVSTDVKRTAYKYYSFVFYNVIFSELKL